MQENSRYDCAGYILHKTEIPVPKSTYSYQTNQMDKT